MDGTLAAGLAGAVGVLTGAGAVLAFRVSERVQGTVPPQPEPVVPDGVSDVLAILRASTVLLDRSDEVVKASPAAYTFGLVRGERFVHDQILEIARQVRRDGEIRESELELRRGPLGEESLDVLARVAPLGTELVLVLVEDRTESRRVDAVRRDFVANVSHELKTPVGALSLLSEAVADASDDPDAVQRFAGRMQYESARLSNLVQELIDLSRLQGEDPLRDPQVVDLDDVAHEAIDRCRTQAQAKSITIALGGEEDVTVLGDRDQLVMAVRNLIDNAVSYSPEHTRVAVAVAVRHEDDLVEITVTDQGIGISPEDRERIFERFYRVDPARSRATGGTGLGLSIVKHVAANHGGEVTVWSAEGAGSTFTVRLPLRPVSPDPQGTSDPQGTNGLQRTDGTAGPLRPTAPTDLSAVREAAS